MIANKQNQAQASTQPKKAEEPQPVPVLQDNQINASEELSAFMGALDRDVKKIVNCSLKGIMEQLALIPKLQELVNSLTTKLENNMKLIQELENKLYGAKISVKLSPMNIEAVLDVPKLESKPEEKKV